MVFHYDYEVEFEIYEMGESSTNGILLGHMVGIDPYDAKVRWIENHEINDERFNQIYALFPKNEWKSKSEI